jgi:glutamate 5-kinase
VGAMAIMVVKMGSSLLVDPSGCLRDDVLRDRVLDLVHVRERGHLPVLVSSGAVACGRAPLGLLGRPLTLAQQQATSAVGQGALFERYREAFARHGVVAAQVLLSSADVERRESYLNVRNALRALLDLGAIPIVNENDATATEGLSVGDNDVLAAQLAILLEAQWLVLLTDREGLYVDGPAGPRLLDEVGLDQRVDELALAGLSGGGPGRGGIRSKAACAAMAAASGVASMIASGRAPGLLPLIANDGSAGTRFRPAPPLGADVARRREAPPELERLAISWLTDLILPRDAVELALRGRRLGRVHLGPGDVVFHAGEPGDALYLIVSGEVVVIHEDGPREHALAVLGPGEFFGEMALLGEPRRTATVRCRTGMSAIRLDARDFRILVEAVPRLQERFAECIHRRSAERNKASSR